MTNRFFFPLLYKSSFIFRLLHLRTEVRQLHHPRSGPARFRRATTARPTWQSAPRDPCQPPASHFPTRSTGRPRARPFFSQHLLLQQPQQPEAEVGLTPRPRPHTGPLRPLPVGADAETLRGSLRQPLTHRATPWVTVGFGMPLTNG